MFDSLVMYSCEQTLKQQTHVPSDGPNELNWIILHDLMTGLQKIASLTKNNK